MGHKGDIENRYATNKQRLPDSIVEDMREAHCRSQEYLQTTKVERASEERIRQDFKRQLLRVAGFGQEEVDKMDLSSLSDDEFQTMVRQKLLGAMVNNGARQRVIPVANVKEHLESGWEFVSLLPNDEAVIKNPVRTLLSEFPRMSGEHRRQWPESTILLREYIMRLKHF